MTILPLLPPLGFMRTFQMHMGHQRPVLSPDCRASKQNFTRGHSSNQATHGCVAGDLQQTCSMQHLIVHSSPGGVRPLSLLHKHDPLSFFSLLAQVEVVSFVSVSTLPLGHHDVLPVRRHAVPPCVRLHFLLLAPCSLFRGLLIHFYLLIHFTTTLRAVRTTTAAAAAAAAASDRDARSHCCTTDFQLHRSVRSSMDRILPKAGRGHCSSCS
jgi:hypothetical protein